MKKCVVGTYWNHLTAVPTAYEEIRKKNQHFWIETDILYWAITMQRKSSFWTYAETEGSGKPVFSLTKAIPVHLKMSWSGYCRICCYNTKAYRYHLNTTYLPCIGTFNSLPSLSLTLVLLIPDMPCLYKQRRSRSVGFWRSQLIWICTVCH